MTESQLRAVFESHGNPLASCGFRRSQKGTYVNPAVARDWKWFKLGAATQESNVVLEEQRDAMAHVLAVHLPLGYKSVRSAIDAALLAVHTRHSKPLAADELTTMMDKCTVMINKGGRS